MSGKVFWEAARIVSHGRCVGFQMAEVGVPWPLFAEILKLIVDLPPPPDPAPARAARSS
jgi:hypothetical protein